MNKPNMSKEQIMALSRKLGAGLVAGNLGDCYALLKDLDYMTMERVALMAGFSAIASKNINEQKNHITKQIAIACGLKKDGYEVRSMTERGIFL